MDESFIQKRIAQLRIDKGVSARDMSLSLGQNENYINHIENKRSLPSLSGLFYICEYFGITPKEFFDDGNDHPARLQAVVKDLGSLQEPLFSCIAILAKELAQPNSTAWDRLPPPQEP